MTTITPEVAAAAAGTTTSHGIPAVLKAFGLRFATVVRAPLKPMSGLFGWVRRLFRRPVAFVAGTVSRVVAVLPRWTTNIGMPLLAATGLGRSLLGLAVVSVPALALGTVRVGAQVLHRSIDIGVDIITWGIARFSQPTADRFGDRMGDFGAWRADRIASFRTFSQNVLIRIMDGYWQKPTQLVVVGVSIGAAVLGAAALFFPGTYAAALMSMPTGVAGYLAGISFGLGWLRLVAISAIAATTAGVIRHRSASASELFERLDETVAGTPSEAEVVPVVTPAPDPAPVVPAKASRQGQAAATVTLSEAEAADQLAEAERAMRPGPGKRKRR